MAARIDRTAWLGRLRGHVGESKTRFEQDRREREAAGKLPKDQNIILTEREVRGEWDASRILMTTLGGGVRPITADDLAAFRQNIRTAKKAFSPRGGAGITARQVIDLASSRPLNYTDQSVIDQGYLSDIDKARREITMAIPASAVNDEVRFLTNAGADSEVTRHHVLVKFLRWNDACSKVAALEVGDEAGVRAVANWLRKQKLAFDCDCKRHRFFLRYVATIGGFAAGRQETGFPKIRNPNLHGVACKHVLRVMAEIESSNAFLRFLTSHLMKVNERRSNTPVTQKQAEDALKNRKRATKIRTTDERKAEAAKARERRALNKVSVKPKKDTKAEKRAAATKQKTQKSAEQLAKSFGLTPEQVIAALQALAKQNNGGTNAS